VNKTFYIWANYHLNVKYKEKALNMQAQLLYLQAFRKEFIRDELLLIRDELLLTEKYGKL
jgi:hypothetical protein